jgi:iron(III) transport system substrate-binding protein
MDGKKTAIIGAIIAAAVIIGVVAVFASTSMSAEAPTQTLTVYSGRSEALVAPIIQKFEQDTGIKVEVRYGGTAPLALAIIEEGRNSPADVFFAQDAGALGALSKEGRLAKIPDQLLDKVDSYFRSEDGDWVGVTGRARVIDYNTQQVNSSELPESIWGLLEPKWKGKVGWSPANGSFQSFVTAMRVLEGDERTKQWLEGMIANEAVPFSGNTQIVEALGRGEISLGLVNNYYLHSFQATNPAFPVAHHYTKGDAGSMVNIAGVAIVDASSDKELAEKFVEYMLDETAQLYFSTNTYEIPLVEGMRVLGPQLPLDRIEKPDLKLADIDDLEGTLNLLRQVGAL